MVEIYTNGSCLSNRGPGGWAAIIVTEKGRAVLKGSAQETTINRIELTAALEGLACALPKSDVRLHTNSQYLRQILTQEKERDDNLDLWKNMDRMLRRRAVEWIWAQGPDKQAEDDNAAEIAVSMIPESPGAQET